MSKLQKPSPTPSQPQKIAQTIPKRLKMTPANQKNQKVRKEKILQTESYSLNEYTPKNCSDPGHTPNSQKRLNITFQKKKKIKKSESIKQNESYQHMNKPQKLFLALQQPKY